MADVNQMITLGVGTPSDIAHLITFGLSLGGAVVINVAPAYIVRIPSDDLVCLIPADGTDV